MTVAKTMKVLVRMAAIAEGLPRVAAGFAAAASAAESALAHVVAGSQPSEASAGF